MSKTIILIISFVAFFSSCTKGTFEPVNPPTEIEKKVVELQWTTALDPTQEVILSDNILVYNDWVITTGDKGDPKRYNAYDKETGEKVWEFIYHDSDYRVGTECHIFQNNVIAGDLSFVSSVDLEKQQINWLIDFRTIEYRMDNSTLAANNKLYLQGIYHLQKDDQINSMFEIDVLTGEYKIIYSIARDQIGSYGFSPPVYYYDEINNRELIIFNEYEKTNYAPQESEQNIVALDLATQEIVWRTKNFSKNYYSNSLHPPIIYEDLVITGGDWSLYSFNTLTGEPVWETTYDQYDYGGLWTKTNHLIYGDKLYVNNSQFDVSCLDPRTGEMIWNNEQGGPNCTDNMVYYEKEDYLVFTSWGYGSVMVLDALDGHTVHREHEYAYSSYTTDAVYDEETDTFYAATYKHLVAFKVNREN